MLGERLRTHHLIGPGLPGARDVVRRYGAMQAQDFPGVLWAIAQRVSAAHRPTEADLRADFDAGVFVRTHVLRPTCCSTTASLLPRR